MGRSPATHPLTRSVKAVNDLCFLRKIRKFDNVFGLQNRGPVRFYIIYLSYIFICRSTWKVTRLWETNTCRYDVLAMFHEMFAYVRFCASHLKNCSLKANEKGCHCHVVERFSSYSVYHAFASRDLKLAEPREYCTRRPFVGQGMSAE